MKINKQAFTLVELVVAVAVFAVASTSVMQFTSWLLAAQRATTWKQNAIQDQKNNEIFWQKYFSGATCEIKSLIVNSSGIITTPAKILVEPVWIRNKGKGCLTKKYSDGSRDWLLWKFKTHVKDKLTKKYSESQVFAYLRGSAPYITLYAVIKKNDKIVLKTDLLSNVTSINASTKFLMSENMTILTLVFVVTNPTSPGVNLKRTSSYRIPTVLKSL